MKHSDYDIGYFLSDPSFVRWAKSPSGEEGGQWELWLEEHPEGRDAFYAARAIVLGIDFSTPDKVSGRKAEILHNILRGDPVAEKRQVSRISRPYPVFLRAAAAVLLLFLVATFSYRAGMFSKAGEGREETALLTRHNPRGQKTSFYLPDNTRVVLNAGSTLSYPPQFGAEQREVRLEGEAFFDVQHDSVRQFVVRSGNIRTRVHGTAFNIRAYTGETISIALERGSVSITAESPGISFPLSPGEKLVVNPNFEQSEKSFFDREQELGWKEGLLVFRDAGMDEFINSIERWYDVKVTVEGVEDGDWEVTGSFRNRGLETVLESLEFSSGVSYVIRGKEVTIYRDNTTTK